MKTMKKNETKNPIETSTITFRFQTLKEVVRFLKTLPSAFPQATVAPAGGSPEVVVVTMDGTPGDFAVLTARAEKAGGKIEDVKHADPDPKPASLTGKALADALNDGDPDAFAQVRTKASLKDGEIVLAEAKTGMPYLTRKDRIIVPGRPVTVDMDDQAVIPCKTWTENGKDDGARDEPTWMAVHDVPADKVEAVQAIIKGQKPAKAVKVPKVKAEKAPKAPKARDPRLPPVGTVMHGIARDTKDQTKVTAVENADGTFTVTDDDAGTSATSGTLRGACMAAVAEAKWARPRNAFCIPYAWFSLNPKTERSVRAAKVPKTLAEAKAAYDLALVRAERAQANLHAATEAMDALVKTEAAKVEPEAVPVVEKAPKAGGPMQIAI